MVPVALGTGCCVAPTGKCGSGDHGRHPSPFRGVAVAGSLFSSHGRSRGAPAPCSDLVGLGDAMGEIRSATEGKTIRHWSNRASTATC